jgi:hypothetical protein
MNNESPMNPLFFNRTVSQILRLYVFPEIEKRIDTGHISTQSLPIEIKQFRVSFRRERGEHYIPVVEINDEVKLIAEVKFKNKKKPGEVVTLADIDTKECYLTPPEYDGRPANYFLWRSTFLSNTFIFDMTQDVPSQFAIDSTRKTYFPILEFVNANEFIKVVRPLEKFRILSSNNWPPAPGYCPQIMYKLHSNPTLITDKSFIDVVSSIYTIDYWKNKLDFWSEIDFFPGRNIYIERAIKAHYQDDFIASIHILVPQFEGIVTDYLEKCIDNLHGHFSEKIGILHEICLSRKVLLYPKEVLEVAFNFISNGSFWSHTSTIKDQKIEINRHGIVHGLFTGFECKEISLKYLILVDMLSYILLNDRIAEGNL